MDTDLGDLSGAVRTIALDFGWFGRRVRVNPHASDLAFVEFLSVADNISTDGMGDPAVMKAATLALRSWLVDLIHPDDFAEFFRLAKSNGQSIQDLSRVAMTIVERVSGFPTERQSNSPNGLPRTGRKSKRGKRSKAELAAAMADRVGEDVTVPERRALRLLHGRPDLQSAVLAARDARRSS